MKILFLLSGKDQSIFFFLLPLRREVEASGGGCVSGVWRWRGAGPGLAVTTPRTRVQPRVETPVADRIAPVAF